MKEQKPKEQKAPAKEVQIGEDGRARADKGEGGGIVLEKTDKPNASGGKARLRKST